jgi:hypothetical protein
MLQQSAPERSQRLIDQVQALLDLLRRDHCGRHGVDR